MGLKALFEDSSNWKNFYQGDFITRKQKFDKDISGGGFSGQPFIKRAIPSGPGRPIGEYYDLSTQALSLDFPVRGGSYEEIASREDFARIDRFFLYYPQGKAFTDKYQALLRSNPKIETGREVGDSNTRIFPIGNSGLGSRNMIEQIASVGVGFHLPNAGSDIFSLTEQEDLYGRIVAKKDTNENRLVSLYNLHILPTPSTGFNPFNETVINTGLGPNRNSIELISYDGGPNSLYGLGTTLIRKATDNVGAIINTNDAPKFLGISTTNFRDEEVQGVPFLNNPLNYQNLLGVTDFAANKNLLTSRQLGVQSFGEDRSTIENIDQQTVGAIRVDNNTDTSLTLKTTSTYDQLMKMGDTTTGTVVVRDFRKNVNDPTIVRNRTNYKSIEINRASRINLGDPGARPANRTTQINDQNDFIGQDFLNKLDVQDGESAFIGDGDRRDIIKFGFDVINNSSNVEAGSVSNSVNFRALLTGYTDNHSAQWDSKKYAGRGENFYNYQGFDRQVSFNFKVAAQSKQEMAPMYRRLNFLVSTLYPDYADTGFMRGNIVRLTVGDLFVRQPGILESLNMTINDEYPWEIAMTEPETGESKDMLETPQIMDVAVSFRPILKTLPKFGVNEPILLTTPNNRYFNPRPVVETVNRITPRGTFDNSLRGIAESIAENQRPDPFNFGSF